MSLQVSIISSFLLLSWISFYGYTIVCLQIEGHLDCFQFFFFFFVIMNRATMNITGSPGVSLVKNPPAMQEMQVQSLCGEDSLEEEMATHASILAWEIPGTKKPNRLHSL